MNKLFEALIKNRYRVCAFVPLLLCALYLSPDAFAVNRNTFKIGLSFPGDYISKIGEVYEPANVFGGLSYFYERLLSPEYSNLRYGLGIGYVLPRSMTKYPGDYYISPVYLFFKTHQNIRENVVIFYLTGQAGIIYMAGDDDFTGQRRFYGRSYYSIGVGLESTTHQLELLYSVYNGLVDYRTPWPGTSQNVFDFKFSSLKVSYGMSF